MPARARGYDRWPTNLAYSALMKSTTIGKRWRIAVAYGAAHRPRKKMAYAGPDARRCFLGQGGSMPRLIIGGYDPDKISRIGPLVGLSSPSWGHWFGSAIILAALRTVCSLQAIASWPHSRPPQCASELAQYLYSISFASAVVAPSPSCQRRWSVRPRLGRRTSQGPLTGVSARVRSHRRTNRWPCSPNRSPIPRLIVHWNQFSLAHCLLWTRRIRTSNL